MDVILEKAKLLRLLILDVDGVLTDGKLIYGPNGTELKMFHVHDGLGMRLLLKSGVEIAIITARRSDVVEKRMQDLEVKYVYQGCSNKLTAYDELKQKLNLQDNEIGYVGDDLPDLPLLRRVGLPITVPKAPSIIKQHAAWVTKTKGGKGAVREVCEMILQAQGTYEEAIHSFLER